MKSTPPLNQNELETSATDDASIEEVCENFCESDDDSTNPDEEEKDEDEISEEDKALLKSPLPLTPKEYVDKCGNHCPVCHSTEIGIVETNQDGSSLWQECSCEECGSTWQDVFSLTTYSKLIVGKKFH